MLAQVTASPMRYRTTESPRFPWQCISAKG